MSPAEPSDLIPSGPGASCCPPFAQLSSGRGCRRSTAAYPCDVTLNLHTDRLLIRDWEERDAEAALEIYGSADVAQWLSPAIDKVTDTATMRAILQAWIEAQPNLVVPAGRWAVVRQEDNEVVGGLLIRLLPPYEEDLEIGWQLKPSAWGHGYATEASRGLLKWAFKEGSIDEIFAVARPHNKRAIATATRLGMEWVGETDKYYSTPDLRAMVAPGNSTGCWGRLRPRAGRVSRGSAGRDLCSAGWWVRRVPLSRHERGWFLGMSAGGSAVSVRDGASRAGVQPERLRRPSVSTTRAPAASFGIEQARLLIHPIPTREGRNNPDPAGTSEPHQVEFPGSACTERQAVPHRSPSPQA